MAVVAALLACGRGEKAANSAAGGTASARAAGAGTPTDSAARATAAARKNMSDANVLAFLTHADSGEIALARTASTRATLAAVKAFARRMVDDHTQMLKDGAAFAQAHNITPVLADSSIDKKGRDAQKDLAGRKAGTAWDAAYMQQQSDAHQDVLDYIDDAMSATQNDAVRDMLVAVREKVDAHHIMADTIRQKIK